MSQPAHERIRDLQNDVRNMEVAPAATVRARGRQRARRQGMVLAAGAVVAVTAGVTLIWPGRPDTAAITPAASPAASVALPMIDCDLTLPDSSAAVRIRVFDGGAPTGLADAVADELRTRRFSVLGAPAAGQPVDVTELRYGPSAIGTATVARALLPADAVLRFDPDRRDETVDLVLGPAFDRLATPTEINQNLVMAGAAVRAAGVPLTIG